MNARIHHLSFALLLLSLVRQGKCGGARAVRRAPPKSPQDADASSLMSLLGPECEEDHQPSIPPSSYEIPPNLKHVDLEVDLQIGFRRIRRALLESDSEFVYEWLQDRANYRDVHYKPWSKNDDAIGRQSSHYEDFLGAEREVSFTMPRNAFVSATKGFQKQKILAYNDNVCTFRTTTQAPNIPFGKTFLAHAQFSIINTGCDTCRLVASVETEFNEDSPRLLKRPISDAMRKVGKEFFGTLVKSLQQPVLA